MDTQALIEAALYRVATKYYNEDGIPYGAFDTCEEYTAGKAIQVCNLWDRAPAPVDGWEVQEIQLPIYGKFWVRIEL